MNSVSKLTQRPIKDNFESETKDACHLTTFIRGMAISQMIGTVCEAGLPDAVPNDGSESVALLARALDVDSGMLLRIVRTLSSFGFFVVDANGQIAHNDCSRMLRQGGFPSQHWAARFWSSPGIWQAWSHLGHSLRSGQEAFQYVHGCQFFEYMQNHDTEENVYRQYMASGYPGRHEDIASVLEFSHGATVIDVGGGTGALVQALLNRHSGINCVVYDQPDVIKHIEIKQQRGLKLQGGNFFESVPSGGDVYVLSWILHDWPDEQAQVILQSCRRAMESRSRLVIVERLLQASPTECDPFDLLLDINMLVLHQGKERTETEFNNLLERCGFSSLRLIRVQPNFSVFETIPI